MLERVEKREPSYTVGGNVSWHSHCGEQYRDSLKTKNRNSMWPSNSTTGHTPWETIIQQDTCTPMFIAALFTIARTWKQHKCPLMGEWIKMWDNGILLSHKKEQNYSICRHMDGSRDCRTDWSKSEREEQILYQFYVKSRKMIPLNLFAKQK